MKKNLFLFVFLVMNVNTWAGLPTRGLPGGYQSMSAFEKQSYLWNEKIKPARWDELPQIKSGGWANLLQSLKALGTLNVSFDHTSDEMPEGRPKIIHPAGCVATITFIPTKDSPYSGIYRGGIGLTRLSLAGDPSKIGYTPGMALKFFIDGEPSVNLHIMNNLDGQGNDQNFFLHEFTNVLPKPKKKLLKLLDRWFRLFVENPRHLRVDHLAERDQSGAVELNPFFPYQILFVPTVEAQIDSHTTRDFREELEDILAGTHLYSVEAVAFEGDEERRHIGDVYTTSEFMASAYGDLQLYFQHHE